MCFRLSQSTNKLPFISIYNHVIAGKVSRLTCRCANGSNRRWLFGFLSSSSSRDVSEEFYCKLSQNSASRMTSVRCLPSYYITLHFYQWASSFLAKNIKSVNKFLMTSDTKVSFLIRMNLNLVEQFLKRIIVWEVARSTANFRAKTVFTDFISALTFVTSDWDKVAGWFALQFFAAPFKLLHCRNWLDSSAEIMCNWKNELIFPTQTQCMTKCGTEKLIHYKIIHTFVCC